MGRRTRPTRSPSKSLDDQPRHASGGSAPCSRYATAAQRVATTRATTPSLPRRMLVAPSHRA
eukprot:12344939-Alexandrium_andersonii.AAC.1